MKLLGLDWRLPLYKRYFHYLRTCRNFPSIIQYERTGKNYSSIELRNGMSIHFPSIIEAHDFFKEIWFSQIYTRYYRTGPFPRVVVDIGANIGTFTLFSKYIWPRSIIFAYEPSPLSYQYLEKNIQTKPAASIYPFNDAVSSKAETKTFFLKELSGANSFYEEINQQGVANSEAILVKTVPLEIVLEKAGGHIDFLKIDCEGAEWSILPGQEQLLQKVGYVAMEYHVPPDKQLSGLASIFERAGFDVLTQSPWKWGDWNLGFLYATNRRV